MLISTLRLGGLLLLLLLAPRIWAQRLAAGDTHNLVIHPDGTLWAWGDNQAGELGDGSQSTQPRPVPVGTATWQTVAANSLYSAGIRSDGTLWTWGRNTYGQLGDGTTYDVAVPQQVGTASTWASVACGFSHTVAVRADGTLWTWGRNNYGQLGNGSSSGTIVQRTPVQVGTATTWRSVKAGIYHTLALKADGTLWAWGDNSQYQLGVNGVQQNTPVQVGTDANWVSISAGSYFSLALKADGTLWSWGENGAGQLGSGTTATRYSPTQVGTATTWRSVAAGNAHSVAVRRDGTLWTWGYNGNGQLGNGTRGDTKQLVPTQVGTATSWANLAAGEDHTLAQRADNSIYAWGINQRSQIGQGFPFTSSFNQVIEYFGVTSWSQVNAGYYTSLAHSGTNTLFGWGANGNGQIGNNSTSDYNTPVPVPVSSWQSTATGSAHTVGVKTDGSLWGWGDNRQGQAGISNYQYYYTPIRIGSATTWKTVAAGYAHSAGVRTDGTLWTWGRDNDGQLGNGTATGNRSTPQQVGSGTTWARVACGASHTAAIRQDGTLWAWGNNASGQVGTGSAGGLEQEPVQVGTATTWASVAAGTSFTVAVGKDGSLWAWGDNQYGQLGDGTTTPRPSPVRIGTASTWAGVAAGYGHVVALRTDGTLWAWGLNANGQLGNGTTTNRLVPQQVSSLASWTDVSAGSYHTLAVRGGTQLWSAGLNDHGQLGQTPVIPVPTLVPNGGLTLAATATAPPAGWALVPNPAHDQVQVLGLPAYSPSGSMMCGANWYVPPPHPTSQPVGWPRASICCRSRL
ncbi:RCC1 domain-containing protein [Hymenobacter chitinivorans]|uniref:Alpha-tubulin suppressor-like RCC1 family protein n=1 Tax=Hymenobacter chitinivorans DSM 11115 TaxID=1121954 RepID=A0A2M9BPU8_9BACT|nr:chromosome condensation regulator RCC1 [Hymenobacter chitinivorans]PJJ59985.1 alpha-tubulin suppressor-like RCC1 family protein [Hymenobacter chitinivorans DSM 11115]